MIGLDDCGKDVLLTFQSKVVENTYQAERKVIMVIKAPRGTLVLFDRGFEKYNRQGQAIKALMKDYKDD